MRKIKIICLGKLREKYLQEAVQNYLKMLSKFAKVEIIEIADVTTFNEPNAAEIEIILSKEAEKIAGALKGSKNICCLCVEGDQKTSEQFADYIADAGNISSELTFVIGGSYGISREIKEHYDKISFSKMTFPHALMRVILLEQIYRAFKINNNETYHK